MLQKLAGVGVTPKMRQFVGATTQCIIRQSRKLPYVNTNDTKTMTIRVGLVCAATSAFVDRLQTLTDLGAEPTLRQIISAKLQAETALIRRQRYKHNNYF